MILLEKHYNLKYVCSSICSSKKSLHTIRLIWDLSRKSVMSWNQYNSPCGIFFYLRTLLTLRRKRIQGMEALETLIFSRYTNCEDKKAAKIFTYLFLKEAANGQAMGLIRVTRSQVARINLVEFRNILTGIQRLQSIYLKENITVHYNAVIMTTMASQITSLKVVYSTVY